MCIGLTGGGRCEARAISSLPHFVDFPDPAIRLVVADGLLGCVQTADEPFVVAALLTLCNDDDPASDGLRCGKRWSISISRGPTYKQQFNAGQPTPTNASETWPSEQRRPHLGEAGSGGR